MLDEYIRLQEATNDHQVRAVIELDGRLDVARLEAAVLRSIVCVPILGCSYSREGGWPRWEAPDAVDRARIRIVPAQPGNHDQLVECLGVVAGKAAPQVVVQVLRREARDALLVTVNHMAFDGAGFKEYLYLLAGIYSGAAVEDAATASARLPRGVDTLLRNIPLRQRLSCLFRRAFEGGGTEVLPADDGASAPRLAVVRIVPAVFRRAQVFCKRLEVTFNDFVLALLARAIFSLPREKRLERITLQTMVDLRRYASRYPVSPFGNFSSMESLAVKNESGELPELVAQVGRHMRRVKARLPGVKNALLMSAARKLLSRERYDSLLSARIRSIGTSTSNLGVLDHERLRFGEVTAGEAYLLASFKNQPAFQLTFSTFRDRVTMVFLGNYSERGWRTIEEIAAAMEREVQGLPIG
jgi:NRPS condensation-like uncharacterized protein